MKRIDKFAGILILCGVSILSCGSPRENAVEPETQIEIHINPTIELISTIHYLAGTKQYDDRLLPGYFATLDAHFNSFKDHPAVQLAKKQNREQKIHGSAPMALAICLGPPPGLKPMIGLRLPPDWLDPRWNEKLISSFLVQARLFARDTKFMDFFYRQKDFHARAISNLQNMMNKENILPWFEDFFGYSPQNYQMYIGLINGNCNYGFTITQENGDQEFISLLGAQLPDGTGAPRYPEDWFISVVVHEYCHSYINHLINNNPSELKQIGEAILVSHREDMLKHGYNTWNVLLFEYVVRACTIRYIMAHKGRNAAQDRISYDKRIGFPFITGLARLFDEYENNRTKYPNVASFMSHIIDYFESCLLKIELEEKINK